MSPVKYKKITHFTYKKKYKFRQQIVIENSNNKKIKSWFNPHVWEKRDNLSFPIVNFPFLDGDVPFPLSYGVYLSVIIEYFWNDQNLVVTKTFLN